MYFFVNIILLLNVTTTIVIFSNYDSCLTTATITTEYYEKILKNNKIS